MIYKSPLLKKEMSWSNQLLGLQSKNQNLAKENKTLKESETSLKIELENSKSKEEKTESEEINSLITEHEEKLKKNEIKYKRELEILHEKLYIRDNKITELQKLCQESGAVNTKVSIKSGEEVSQISEKIRSEYIAAIEILQSNLETLKLKYQNEVAGRKR